ncbi:hypothetical protein LTR56_004047 [Elasticomyces elasticus]|nr:hypothetical protein LTR56_004047 [Elasticomyces elasticus]
MEGSKLADLEAILRAFGLKPSLAGPQEKQVLDCSSDLTVPYAFENTVKFLAISTGSAHKFECDRGPLELVALGCAKLDLNNDRLKRLPPGPNGYNWVSEMCSYPYAIDGREASAKYTAEYTSSSVRRTNVRQLEKWLRTSVEPGTNGPRHTIIVCDDSAETGRLLEQESIRESHGKISLACPLGLYNSTLIESDTAASTHAEMYGRLGLPDLQYPSVRDRAERALQAILAIAFEAATKPSSNQVLDPQSARPLKALLPKFARRGVSRFREYLLSSPGTVATSVKNLIGNVAARFSYSFGPASGPIDSSSSLVSSPTAPIGSLPTPGDSSSTPIAAPPGLVDAPRAPIDAPRAPINAPTGHVHTPASSSHTAAWPGAATVRHWLHLQKSETTPSAQRHAPRPVAAEPSRPTPSGSGLRPVVSQHTPLSTPQAKTVRPLRSIQAPSAKLAHPAPRPPGYDDEWFTSQDIGDVRIDSAGSDHFIRPYRVDLRVRRNEAMKNALEIWFIAAAKHYKVPHLSKYLTADELHIDGIQNYSLLAEAIVEVVPFDLAVRKHVGEIVELRQFSINWHKDLVEVLRLPSRCGIAKSNAGHQAFLEVMVSVYDTFCGRAIRATFPSAQGSTNPVLRGWGLYADDVT